MKFSKDTKFIVHKRDRNCLICGSKENLTVAHIVPNRHDGKNTPVNGVLLCEKCHKVLDFPLYKDIDYSMWIDYIVTMYLMNYYGLSYREMMGICNASYGTNHEKRLKLVI